MKHPLALTLLLVGMFLFAQLIGIFIVEHYTDRTTLTASGEPGYKDLPLGLEPPDVSPGAGLLFIIIGVLFGTGIVLLLIKFRKAGIWRVWFYLSATLSLCVAIAAFIPQLGALVLSAILGFFKVFKPNTYVHNVTELFLYGGLAAIFVPLLNVFAAIILLLLISCYDMFAVWKSKHMVTMARFQAESHVFAGFLIPKRAEAEEPTGRVTTTASVHHASTKKGKKPSNRLKLPLIAPAPQQFALLGGGDIAFPLLFTGAVLKNSGIVPELFLIPVCTAIALFGLLYFSEKGKFYPAMPFISIGVFCGYGAFLIYQFIF